MLYLFSRLAFDITNNFLCLSHDLVHDLFRLSPRLLHRLHVRTGSLLWCCNRLLDRSSLLDGSRGTSSSGSLGLSDATRSYFAGAGLRRIGFGGRASFCGRDDILDLLDETGLGVAFVETSVS
jgi:hypothetical protein